MHALQAFQHLLQLLDRHCQHFWVAAARNDFLDLLWRSQMRKELLQEVTVNETERSDICVTTTSGVTWHSESVNESIS